MAYSQSSFSKFLKPTFFNYSFNEILISAHRGQNADFNNYKVIAKTEKHFVLKPRWLIGNSIKGINTNKENTLNNKFLLSRFFNLFS